MCETLQMPPRADPLGYLLVPYPRVLIPPGYDHQHTARLIGNKRGGETDLMGAGVKEMLDAARTRMPRTLPSPPPLVGPDSDAWLGRKLGDGAGGTAYPVKATALAAANLKKLRRSVWPRVTKQMPEEGEMVVIKLTPLSTETKLEEAMSEALTHRGLSGVAACRNSDRRLSSRPLCAADYVPPFFFAGRIKESGRAYFVTVMGMAAGKTLDKHLKRARMNADLYVNIERAVCSLWAAGVAHGDLHTGNIMYDAVSNKVTVIDYGFGVLMPRGLASSVGKSIVKAIGLDVRSLGEVWMQPGESPVGTGLESYVDRVLYSRHHYTFVNPNGHSLMQSFSKLLSANQKRAVPGQRRRLWGYTD